jgi:hypothetical protein
MVEPKFPVMQTVLTHQGEGEIPGGEEVHTLRELYRKRAKKDERGHTAQGLSGLFVPIRICEFDPLRPEGYS